MIWFAESKKREESVREAKLRRRGGMARIGGVTKRRAKAIVSMGFDGGVCVVRLSLSCDAEAGVVDVDVEDEGEGEGEGSGGVLVDEDPALDIVCKVPARPDDGRSIESCDGRLGSAGWCYKRTYRAIYS